MNRKFLRLYFFIHKVIFAVFLIFTTFSLAYIPTKATVCNEGNLWNNGTNECSDILITADNLEEKEVKQIIAEEKEIRTKEITETINIIKKSLDSEIEDEYKNSEEVLYVKKILDDSIKEMSKNYDNLIDTLVKKRDSTFWLHDDVGNASLLSALVFVNIKLRDFYAHLETVSSATTSEKLKKMLESFISQTASLSSLIKLFRVADITDDSGRIIHESILYIRENGTVDMGIFPPRFKLGGNNFEFKYLISKDLFDTKNQIITSATPALNTFSYTLSKCPRGIRFMNLDPFSSEDTIVNTDSCSIVAYLINLLLDGINQMLTIFVSWAGAFFDWIMEIGVYGFNNWVTNSGAYDIWRTIILALVTSLLLPLVFYLIIRMLIDNDTSNIEKILPKILFTALFVYFSFSIVGWIIDQSNILTIYTYRSMTGGTQPISDIMIRTLSPNTKALKDIAMGAWDSTPLYLLQVVISSVSLMVIFQGAILIFARTVTLLLVMIFSPLMLLPVGIHSFIDKYRDMVIKYFSNGVLMGPIFMFLLLLGVKVGSVAGEIVGKNSASTLNSAIQVGPNVLAAAITSILVIIVLQLAITVAKNLSGELGTLLSQKVSAFTGNLALGGTGSALRNTLGRFALKANAKGWMKGKEGSGRHRLMTKLYGNLGKNTYDVRGTKTFKAAAGTGLGKSIGLNDLGTASRSTAKSRLDKQMYDASRYYNSLGNDGKKRYINNLRNSIPGSYNHNVADKLEGKNGDRYTSSLKEKMENDSTFNEKFNTANREKDAGLREQEMSKVLNEHFKEEGMGDKHFSETINKPENVNLKKEYVKIMREEKDETKRTEKLQTFINDKFSKSSSSNTPNSSQPSTPTVAPAPSASTTSAPTPNSSTSTPTPSQSPSAITNNTSSGVSRSPAPSVSDIVAQQRLKERLREKYGTSERMENGKIVKNYDKQLLDNRIRDQKSQREDQYQENVLREVKNKEEKIREERGRPESDKKDILAQGSLKERLQQKYNKEAVKEYRKNQEETYQEKVLKEAREKGGIQENYKNNPIVSIGQSSNSPTFTTSNAETINLDNKGNIEDKKDYGDDDKGGASVIPISNNPKFKVIRPLGSDIEGDRRA